MTNNKFKEGTRVWWTQTDIYGKEFRVEGAYSHPWPDDINTAVIMSDYTERYVRIPFVSLNEVR